MTHRLVSTTAMLAVLSAAVTIAGSESALPVVNGRPAVATINADAIALDELVAQLDGGDVAKLAKGQATAEEIALLDRLVIVRLITQEAATMGIAELPEIQKQVEVTARQILRDTLADTIAKNAKPDEKVVEQIYKDLTQEWKTASLVFQDEQDARAAGEELAGGGDFEKVTKRLSAQGKAKIDGDDQFHRKKDYLPEIADALAKLQAGQVSPVIRIQAGFVIFRVAEMRYADDPDAKKEARRTATGRARQARVDAFEQELMDKYVVVHKDVVEAIDYEAAQPGLDALLKDTRAVAEIKGAGPLTVGDLSDYLKLQFFHGGDPVAEGKRMNAKKQAALDATLRRRVLNFEAARRGIDKTHTYLDTVNAYRDSLVFESFVKKVIEPDSKLREEDVRSYYDAHLKDYSYPAMVRLRSLAFTKRGDAEEATEKLRKGTDFGWLAANADDQVEASARTLTIGDGQLLMSDTLPDGVQKALSDPKAGDVKLYAHPDGQFYVFAVQDVVAANAKPYMEVREDIARKLYAEKLKKGVEDYAAKLRAASKVAVYLRKTN